MELVELWKTGVSLDFRLKIGFSGVQVGSQSRVSECHWIISENYFYRKETPPNIPEGTFTYIFVKISGFRM